MFTIHKALALIAISLSIGAALSYASGVESALWTYVVTVPPLFLIYRQIHLAAYRKHLQILTLKINRYLQSREYEEDFQFKGPTELAPVAKGLSSLILEMRQQKNLTSIVKEVASLANSHTSFKMASRAAIDRVCSLAGWRIADFYLVDRQGPESNLQREFRIFQKELPEKVKDRVAQAIDSSLRNFDLSEKSFAESKASIWYKVQHGNEDSLEFAIPVFVEDRVYAIMIFYGFPQIHFGSDLIKVMDVVSSELSQVKDREKQEQELKETTQMMVLAGKMATIGEMAASIAHEINNPLAVIQGRAEQLSIILEKENPDKELAEKVIENLVSTVERIGKTVSGLKNISYNESLEGFVATPLEKIVGAVDDIIAEKIRSNSITFEILKDIESSIFVDCHSTQISQVLINLINNSIDAVSGQDKPWIHLDYSIEGAHLLLKVIDSGKGVPPRIIERVMDSFFTTKGKGKGTGLGLSISTKIAELHSGKLTIDIDHPNTCFIFELPLKQTIEQASA